MVVEIESVAALDAQELAIDAGVVAIISANNFVVAHAERGLASVRAMRADGADMLHLPRPRLVAIRAAGQRADRADVDAHAALVAFEMIVMVRRDLVPDAAVDDPQRADSHALVADPHAAEAQDAARRIVEDHRRPLLLGDVQLGLLIAALAGAVAEHHVLQLALAALVAHRAIERMIGEQKFQRRLARLGDLRRLGPHHHALGDRQRTARHQLRHLLHFHQAHAAGGLQRQALPIAEGRDLDARPLRRIDHEHARRRFDRLAVDGELDGIRHWRGNPSRPDALRIRREIFRRSKWSASPRRRPADRTSGPTCFSRGRR